MGKYSAQVQVFFLEDQRNNSENILVKILTKERNTCENIFAFSQVGDRAEVFVIRESVGGVPEEERGESVANFSCHEAISLPSNTTVTS